MLGLKLNHVSKRGHRFATLLVGNTGVVSFNDGESVYIGIKWFACEISLTCIQICFTNVFKNWCGYWLWQKKTGVVIGSDKKKTGVVIGSDKNIAV